MNKQNEQMQDTTTGTCVIVGEGTVEVGQHVWRDGRSSFPMAFHGGKFDATLEDGRKVSGSYALGLGGDFVVDVKWASVHGNGEQDATFVVGAKSLVDAVLALVSQGRVEERAPGVRSSAVPVRPRAVSCGCCDGGCVCVHHQDVPRGVRAAVCEYHARVGHPGVTEVQS